MGSRVLWVQNRWGHGKASQVCWVQRTTKAPCPSHSPQLCCVALGRSLALSGPLFPIMNPPCLLVLPAVSFQSHKVNQKPVQAEWWSVGSLFGGLAVCQGAWGFRNKPNRVHALWVPAHPPDWVGDLTQSGASSRGWGGGSRMSRMVGGRGWGPGNTAQWQLLCTHHLHGLVTSSQQIRWLLPPGFIDEETEAHDGAMASSLRSHGW